MNFYDSNLGDCLIEESVFPTEIKEFLQEEERLLTQAIFSCDLLVEVGCMHGRYLDWALEKGKAYAGIDVVSRYIKLGQARAIELGLPAGRCQFILGGAETIDTLLKLEIFEIEQNRTLLIFPFNSFGNMQSCVPVINSLKRSQLPFFVSTYLTTPKATTCRKQYYGACSYQGLTMIKDSQGVTFKAKNGFCSIAYHPDFLLGIFKSANLAVETNQFAQIGIAYTTPGINTADESKDAR